MDTGSLTEERRIHTVHPVKNPLSAALPGPTDWPAFVGLALGAVAFTGLLALLSHRGYDDPYITFRYARNLLAGRGFVYNAGQQVLSTTAPLYGFLLAGLGYLWDDVPTVSQVVGVACLVLSAITMGAFTWKRDRMAAGLIAALLLSLSPDLWRTLGSESCTVILFILAGLLAYSRARHSVAAVLLAIAVLVRPDAILAFVAIGTAHLVRRQRVPWRAVWLWVAIVGVWYSAIWWAYGSPLPATLGAKQQQGQMAISERFAMGLVNLAWSRIQQPLYWLPACLGLVGLGPLLTRRSVWTPLLLWTVLYVAAYSLLGVSRYFWYYAPLAPAFAVLVAEGAAEVLAAAATRLPYRVVQGATGLLVLALVAPLIKSTLSAGWNRDPRLQVYQEIGLWLRDATGPEATVGALEVGIIGYYSERTMIDFAGLLQPEVSRQLTRSSTYQDSAAWAIQRYAPDYVVLHSTGFSGVSDSDWFKAQYGLIRRFSDLQALDMTLFARSADG